MQIKQLDLHNRTLKLEQQGIHEPHRSHVWLFIPFLFFLHFSKLRRWPSIMGKARLANPTNPLRCLKNS